MRMHLLFSLHGLSLLCFIVELALPYIVTNMNVITIRISATDVRIIQGHRGELVVSSQVVSLCDRYDCWLHSAVLSSVSCYCRA